MKVEIFNYSQKKTVSPSFLKLWVKKIVRELKKRKVSLKELKKNLIIAFVAEKEMKKLNAVFRGKNKATDILSFSSDYKNSKIISAPSQQNILGELALCPSYIKKHSKERCVSVREASAYIVLHGLLHLLGFEHEKSRAEAEKMFQLQDQVFAACWSKKNKKTYD